MDKKGKIKLLVSVSVVALIGMFLFLSAVPTTNVKEYDSVNKVITIKDSSGVVISDITLNTPLNYIVPRGYQKVAEFTIDNKLSSQTISSVLENLEFYDVDNGMQKFVRVFDYKYEKNLGFETVNDYGTVCVEETSANGTVSNVCNQVITGTHQEEIFGWTNLNSLGEIPTGKIKIGVFTNVEKGDVVEWVPTFLGVEVSEWAVWTEDLNVDLVAYYKMDEASGTIIDSLGSTNGIPTQIGYGATGILGTGLSFNSSSFINITGMTSTSGNYTFSFWANPSSSTNERYIVDSQTGRLIPALAGSSDVISFWDGTWRSFGVTATQGTLKHYIFAFDGSAGKATLFIDGTKQATEPTYVAKNIGGFVSIGANYANAGSHYLGVLDELGIWNRTLTSSEISDLYNGGSGITYTNDFPDWNITFNLTDSVTGVQIDTSSPQDNFDISCDNGFNVTGVENDPYLATNFGKGIVECTFFGLTTDSGSTKYFDETLNVTADSNKTIEVSMSPKDALTQEEHDWLELVPAIHDCIINGIGCA